MGNKPGGKGAKFDPKSKEGEEEQRRLLVNALKNVPLLAKLSYEDLGYLVGGKKSKDGSGRHYAFDAKEYEPGEYIIKQRDIGDGFYIIKDGIATVEVEKKGTSKVSSVAELGPGDYFGERALLNSAPRAASVRAKEKTTCLFWTAKNFFKIFTKDKLNIQFAKRAAISAEQMGQSVSKFTPPVNPVKHKSEDQKQLIFSAVEDNVLFQGLDIDHINKVIDEMYKLEIKGPSDLSNNDNDFRPPIVQGERGDLLYVVESGLFDIRVKTKEGKDISVATRGKGTLFGELALMYNAPRAATVLCLTEKAVVWVVDRFTFRRILHNVSSQQLNQYNDFLRKVELLAPLAEFERNKVAEAMEEVHVEKGSIIMKQGQKGNCMYIVRSGEVVVHVKMPGHTEGKGKEVKRYTAGEYFGERALFNREQDQKRAATCTAVTDAWLLKLDRNAVYLLLGPVEDILKAGMKEDGSSERKAEGIPTKKVARVYKGSLKELTEIGVLGKGSFGHVTLVEDERDGKTYALKAVSKVQIVQTGQQGHIKSEKRVMEVLDHPFLIRLFATFNDKRSVYFLLEPSLGGELFSVLRARTFFDEETAKFYAASVVLAFEYMHDRNIIYRDLKPENLLLDADGYLKVTDFGFAKEVKGRTWTLCGTPDYLAPEIVAGKGHGKGVDWWCTGILIYEMLASYPPFYDEDPMKTYAKIMHGSVTFPTHFSKDAVSLIRKLLHHKPHKRLGVVKGGAKCIKQHGWFRLFDWRSLIEKRMYNGKGPIVPEIKHKKDISNFDEYPDQETKPPLYEPQEGDDWDKEFGPLEESRA